MPHIVIEYSANLDAKLDVTALVSTVHDAALATGVFPIGGTRTRAVRRDAYKVADGHRDNAFVHVVLRIGHGRPMEVRRAAGQQVFDAVCAAVDRTVGRAPLALSLEVQEIDPSISFKRNNLHELVQQRNRIEQVQA